MANQFIIDDKVLILYAQDLGNYTDRYIPYREFIKDISLFNYSDYSAKYGIAATENKILELIETQGIRVLISCPFATDYQLSPYFYRTLRKKVKVVFIFNDDDNYLHSYGKYIAQNADAVITTDHLAVAEYTRLEIPAILYLHSARTDVLFPAPAGSKKDIDVCFVGDSTKNDRLEYVEYLRTHGINVSLFGIGSGSGFLPYSDIGKLFGRSKINLSFTKMSEPNWVNSDEPLLHKIRQNKGKPIEVAFTRSFCLSEYAPALSHFFEIGKEIDVFYGKEDLLEKVKFYLSNDKLREEIALNAYNRAMKEYLDEVYYKKTFTQLNNILSGPAKNTDNRVFLSEPFKSKSVNGLTFLMFVMLKSFRILPAAQTFFLLFQYGPRAFLTGFSGGVKRSLAYFMSLLFKGRQSIYAKKAAN